MRSRLQPKERGGEQEAGLRPAPTASPECRMNVTGTVGSVPPGEQGGLGCRLLFKQRMSREGAGAGEEEGGGRGEESAVSACERTWRLPLSVGQVDEEGRLSEAVSARREASL